MSASYPSLLGLSARNGLLNPMFTLFYTGSHAFGEALAKTYEPIEKELSCDVALINLRTMQASSFDLAPSDNSALIIHRQGFNACYKPVGLTCSTNAGKVYMTSINLAWRFQYCLLQISLAEFLPELYGDSVRQMTLSLMYEGIKVEKGFTVSIKPMEMYSFLLRR